MTEIKLNDGIYTAKSRGHFGDVPVRMTVTRGEIAGIEILQNEETHDFIYYPALKIPEIVKKYKTLDVDLIEGAAFSSRAVINAITECIVMAGGDAEALLRAPGPEKDPDTVHEMSCSVCVLGTGGSGSAAAVAAAEAGASVIVLERAGYNGGITTGANMLLAVNSSLHKEAGVKHDIAEIYNHMMLWNHFRGNGRLISKYLHKSASTIDWLNERGIELEYLGAEEAEPVFDCAIHIKYGYRDRDIRRAQLKTLLEHILPLGGQVVYEARAKKLIVEGGVVRGVSAELDDGSTLNVRADAIVVATGSYDGNKVLAEKYLPDKARICMPAFLAQGDGLQMCTEVGADTKDLGARVLHLTRPDRSSVVRAAGRCDTVMQMASFPANIIISYRGRRYVNERLIYNSIGIANANSAQGNSCDFLMVFCEGIVRKLVEEGPLSLGVSLVPSGFTQNFLEPGYFNELRGELKTAVEVGMCVEADTVEELAGKLGIDPLILRFEIDRYNNFCDEGCDRDFFKPSELLHKMDEGPYYALFGTSESYGSVGGVRVDDELRALTAERDPIPGLYCAGAAAGGIWGNDSYGMVLGSTLGWAFNSGRMAGENAADYAISRRSSSGGK